MNVVTASIADLGMTSHRYRSGEFEVHALVRDGRGPSVVLLHGAAGNALAWLPILDAFDDRRLILVDLPGHGDSPPIEDWALEPLAKNLADAIGAGEATPPVWGGHSWGGKLAAILAGTRPEVARALLLVDPSPASPVPITAEGFVAAALDPEIGPWPSFDAAIASVRALPQYLHWRPAVERAFRRGIRLRSDGNAAGRTLRSSLLAITEATLLHDDRPSIQEVRCPTLLLFAEQSLAWQESTNGVALGGLPNVRREVLPGNHWLMFEPPDPLVGCVRSWLGKALS